MAGDDEAPSDARDDPDRAAILARRRRFVALALSGLASSGCKARSEPCLSVAAPHDPGDEEPADEVEPSGLDGPIVEDPGAPLQTPETESDTGSDTGEPPPEPPPQPCLSPKPRPKPCLKKMPPPRTCLFVSD